MENTDWKDLFGSDDDNDDSDIEPIVSFDAIPGLKLIRKGLTHEEQMKLTHALIDNGHFSGEHVNQAMCFGELPSYISWLSGWVKEKYPGLFPADILHREPIFDQAILNLYKKGEGICSHVDLLRFEDGILIVSLLSSCVMTMRPALSNKIPSYNNTEHDSIKDPANTQQFLLCPGDVLALSGEARYNWEHGIKEQTHDYIDDQIIERGTRISVTLRKLKPGTTLNDMATTSSRK